MWKYCFLEGVIYRATVKPNTKIGTYTGLTERPLKSRFTGHSENISNQNYVGTRWSTHVCQLKASNLPCSLRWHVIDGITAYNQTTGQCRICLKEKLSLCFCPRRQLWTLGVNCTAVHQRKHLLDTLAGI